MGLPYSGGAKEEGQDPQRILPMPREGNELVFCCPALLTANAVPLNQNDRKALYKERQPVRLFTIAIIGRNSSY
jgi:hypothetical protein